MLVLFTSVLVTLSILSAVALFTYARLRKNVRVNTRRGHLDTVAGSQPGTILENLQSNIDIIPVEEYLGEDVGENLPSFEINIEGTGEGTGSVQFSIVKRELTEFSAISFRKATLEILFTNGDQYVRHNFDVKASSKDVTLEPSNRKHFMEDMTKLLGVH